MLGVVGLVAQKNVRKELQAECIKHASLIRTSWHQAFKQTAQSQAAQRCNVVPVLICALEQKIKTDIVNVQDMVPRNKIGPKWDIQLSHQILVFHPKSYNNVYFIVDSSIKSRIYSSRTYHNSQYNSSPPELLLADTNNNAHF